MRIINHRQFRMDPLNMDVAPRVLVQAHLLQKSFISAGTLLGLYRDGDFIPGDSDIDIDMIGYDGIEYDVFKALGHMDLIRTGFHWELPHQLAFMYQGTIFDVWILWMKENFVVNHNDMGIMQVPAKFYLNPEIIETKYGIYRAPGPVKDYLAFRYGPDWRTPRKSKGIYTERAA